MKLIRSFEHESVRGFAFGSQPIGRPSLFSHAYFVDGLLIDTGHRNMRKEVMETLSPLPVEQIFLTHHHEDHTANLLPLQSEYQCSVFASARCAEIMKNPPKISFAQWILWGKSDPLFNLQVQETEIRTPKHTFQLIPIPGHAVDMMALYEPNKGWLFSADLWVKEYIRYFMRSESVKQQIESIREVLKLNFRVLFCSHNPQLTGGRELLAKKLQFFENFYGEVAALHKKGVPAAAILKEMGWKEKWFTRMLSGGELSTMNMVKAVIRDEKG